MNHLIQHLMCFLGKVVQQIDSKYRTAAIIWSLPVHSVLPRHLRRQEILERIWPHVVLDHLKTHLYDCTTSISRYHDLNISRFPIYLYILALRYKKPANRTTSTRVCHYGTGTHSFITCTSLLYTKFVTLYHLLYITNSFLI